MRQNFVEPASPQTTIRRMRHGWGLCKSPNKHCRYAYFLMPFHYYSGSTNTPHCNVTHTAHVQLSIKIVRFACVSFWLSSPEQKWFWRCL